MTATVSEEMRARNIVDAIREPPWSKHDTGHTFALSDQDAYAMLIKEFATIRSEARAAGSAEEWRKIVDCVDWIVKSHPEKVAQAKTQSQPSLYGWFVGQTMKAMNGEADPDFVLYVVGNAIAAAPRPAPDETKP